MRSQFDGRRPWCCQAAAGPGRRRKRAPPPESWIEREWVNQSGAWWHTRASARSRSGRCRPACWRDGVSPAGPSWACGCCRISPRPPTMGARLARSRADPDRALLCAAVVGRAVCSGPAGRCAAGLQPLAHLHQLVIAPRACRRIGRRCDPTSCRSARTGWRCGSPTTSWS